MDREKESSKSNNQKNDEIDKKIDDAVRKASKKRTSYSSSKLQALIKESDANSQSSTLTSSTALERQDSKKYTQSIDSLSSQLNSKLETQSVLNSIQSSESDPIISIRGNSSKKYSNRPCDATKLIQQYKSEIETKILESKRPLQVNEAVTYNLKGKKFVWLNKKECDEWKGSIPLSEYPIDFDEKKAQVVKLKHEQAKDQTRTYKIKYLKPPAPPTPPPIIIRQKPDIPATPAPPLILRELASDSELKEIQHIREKPPILPVLKEEIILIEGKKLPPQPRRVIVEKIAAVPAKKVINVDRWLPYEQTKRKIILEAKSLPPCIEQTENTVYEWEHEIKETAIIDCLGEEPADPVEYNKKYGTDLKNTNELPQVVLNACELDTQTKPVENVLASDLEMFKKFYAGLSEDEKKIIDKVLPKNL